MIQAFFVSVLFLLLGYLVIRNIDNSSLRKGDDLFLKMLLWYHFLMTVVYYLYAINNPSDSIAYYSSVESELRGDSWLNYYGTGTTFIRFMVFPLIQFLGLGYESCMVLFAFFGFLAFLLFFLFYREQIKFPIKIFGIDAAYFVLALPNAHFWSASIGKGSVILLGVAIFVFALAKLNRRILLLFVGGIMIYHIRPHIFFVFLIALALGYTLSSKGIGWLPRSLIIILSLFILNYIYSDILILSGLEDESILDPLISHRATELAKATSGIDITNYSIVEKLFAFVFRPLFFDSPGILGLIISFENLIYLLLFIEFLRPSNFKFLLKAGPIVKTSLFAFGAVTIALAQISGNLGIAMRQKSQVMLLILFVILKIKEDRKISQYNLNRKRSKIKLMQEADLNLNTR